MASYTIHVPPAGAGEVPDTERFRLVRDGITPWAVILWPFWFLARRLWLGALGVYALWAILNIGLYMLGAPRPVAVMSWGLFLVLIGLEAASIERWTLARRGWTELGVTVAGSRDEAEERAIVALTSAIEPAAPRYPLVRNAAPPIPSATPLSESQVLGLFPEARR